MESRNYSAEAMVFENGKYTKGTLTLFIDEYVFAGVRTNINWGATTCEQGTVKVRSFLFSSEKPYIRFKEQEKSSSAFIVSEDALHDIVKLISEYAAYVGNAPEEKFGLAQRAEQERQQKKEGKGQNEESEQSGGQSTETQTEAREEETEETASEEALQEEKPEQKEEPEEKSDERRLEEEEEERRQQEENEQRIREEARRKAEEEFRRQKEEESRQKEEALRKEKELSDQKRAEKKERIEKEVEHCKNEPRETVTYDVSVKKAASCILENPYRILGISCNASNEDANRALDKLKKLARLKALSSYQSPFDIAAVESPVRDLSVAQNALALLKDESHKWFWFSEADACYAWYSGKYRMELSRDGQEYGTYDLFLANYMYAILCDYKFETAQTWKHVLEFYCFICEDASGQLLGSRFSEKEAEGKTPGAMLCKFKKAIFKPLLQLCETDDLLAVLRLHKYIKACDNKQLNDLGSTLLEKVVYWFKSKENDAMAYLREFDETNLSEEQRKQIRERGETYCQTVEKVLEPVLTELRADVVRYEMIKESYKTATYQFMFVLHKCANKSDAIYFANKTYTYCKEDDRQRIKNTFGEANIKFIDWNVPHTAWDIKGDNYFYGSGCEVDYTQAVYWYHKAADEGNMCSQNSLGICYRDGLGVPQSNEQAVAWFEKACESGSPDGAYNLAECYYAGSGVEKNIGKALEFWEKAAKLGHPSAAEKRSAVYEEVQTKRKKHRAQNHICHDIGFQMPMGNKITAEVTLNRSAFVYLVNQQSYQNYLAGKEFSHSGGYASTSPYTIDIKSANHWYIIVDNGNESIEGIVSEVKVKTN